MSRSCVYCRQCLQTMPCQWNLGTEGELLHVQGHSPPRGRPYCHAPVFIERSMRESAGMCACVFVDFLVRLSVSLCFFVCLFDHG